MAILWVQQSGTVDAAAANTITTPATTSAITAGNCIVAVIESFSGGASPVFLTSSGMTDNGANTWPTTASARIGDNNSGGRSCEIWVLPNAKAKASYTASATFTAGTGESRLTIVEFSGVKTTSPVDATGTAATSTGGASIHTLAVSTTGSITNAGDLLISNLSISTGIASSAITVPTNFSSIELDQNDATSISCGSAYLILTAGSGVQTATWNWSASGNTNVTSACLVALLPASSPVTGVPIAWVT